MIRLFWGGGEGEYKGGGGICTSDRIIIIFDNSDIELSGYLGLLRDDTRDGFLWKGINFRGGYESILELYCASQLHTSFNLP